MDDILTPQELKIQIQQNMKEHLEKSRKDSNAFFKLVDRDNDRSVDTNDDNVITREEFIDGTPANDPNPENAKMEEAERERRLVEFDEEIDVNGDGKANFRELYEYVDPQNFRMAAKEVNDVNNLSKIPVPIWQFCRY
uniref:Stromal cell-derived factor 4 n=1 Tax=Caenorhabditis japonica TaxID=281687 RepID=A0A8R1INW4_CAEJA